MMNYVFVGRYSDKNWVDIIPFIKLEKAEEHYERELIENNSNYDSIELLKQTSSRYFEIIRNWSR